MSLLRTCLHQFAFAQFSNPVMCSGGYSDRRQCDEICTPGDRSYVCSNSSEDRKIVERTVCGIRPTFRKVNFWSNQWANGEAIPFPALVDGSPRRQCNSVQEHIHLLTIFEGSIQKYLVFSVYRICAGGQKNNVSIYDVGNQHYIKLQSYIKLFLS